MLELFRGLTDEEKRARPGGLRWGLLGQGSLARLLLDCNFNKMISNLL